MQPVSSSAVLAVSAAAGAGLIGLIRSFAYLLVSRRRVERRDSQRTGVRYRVVISWSAGKQLRAIKGRIVDMSESGLCFQASLPFPVGALVFVDAPGLRSRGSGYVQNCRPRLVGLLGYATGVRLKGAVYRSL